MYNEKYMGYIQGQGYIQFLKLYYKSFFFVSFKRTVIRPIILEGGARSQILAKTLSKEVPTSLALTFWRKFRIYDPLDCKRVRFLVKIAAFETRNFTRNNLHKRFCPKVQI